MEFIYFNKNDIDALHCSIPFSFRLFKIKTDSNIHMIKT